MSVVVPSGDRPPVAPLAAGGPGPERGRPAGTGGRDAPSAERVVGLEEEKEFGWAVAAAAQLEDEDWNVRKEAAASLGALPTRHVLRHVASLQSLLDEDAEDEWAVRCEAVDALTAHGELALESLDDVNAHVRAAALGGLARHGNRSHSQLALDKLVDHEGEVRGAAAEALVALEADNLDNVAELLGSRLAPEHDLWTRGAAAEALGRLPAACLAPWANALASTLENDPEPHVRATAATSLGVLGEAALSDVAGSLAAALARDEDRWVRVAASESLGRAGAGAAPFADLLATALSDVDSGVRRAAGLALSAADAAAKSDIGERVEPLLSSPDQAVRFAAVEAIGRLPVSGARHAPALARLAADDEAWQVRHAAVDALGRLTPPPSGEAANVAERLADGNGNVRRGAVTALARLAAPPGREDGDRAGDGALRAAAARAAELSADAMEPGVRWAGVSALGSMGDVYAAPHYAAVVAALRNDPDRTVRQAATEALGALHVDGGANHFGHALDDDAPAVRRAALLALAGLGAEGVPHAARVAALIADADRRVQGTALQALADLCRVDAGQVAALADPVLQPLQNHKVPVVRRAAREALKHLQ